jgi:hypothetical protein
MTSIIDAVSKRGFDQVDSVKPFDICKVFRHQFHNHRNHVVAVGKLGVPD